LQNLIGNHRSSEGIQLNPKTVRDQITDVLKSLPKRGFGACLCTTGQLTSAEIVDKAGKR
jgi:hypothetical protein